jgi:hypothetical protein
LEISGEKREIEACQIGKAEGEGRGVLNSSNKTGIITVNN